MSVISSTTIPKYYENFFCVKEFNTNKLHNMPSVNPNDNQGDVVAQEKLEAAKNKLRNVDTIDLSARWIEKPSCDNQKLILNNIYGKPVDYYQFDGFINGIEGLSKEQTAALKNSVLTATESQTNHKYETTYPISLPQTNFELKFISKNLIPEKYQEGFNSIVEKYTEGLSKDFNTALESTAKSIINTKDPALIESGWVQKGHEMLKSVQNGTHIEQLTTKIYSKLYKNIENSNSTDVRENLDSVFNDIIKNGVAYNKGSATEQGLANDVKFLKEKWNSVVYAMGNYKDLMFKTSINELA